MAKIYGLFGAMTGKVADAVMIVRNGEQIVRKYQPVVYNPSTPAQVAVRAKLKLMSQLSAVFGGSVGFRRQGAVSPRNLFVKANYKSATFSTATNKASIPVEGIDLSGGSVGLPGVAATRSTGGLDVALSAPAPDIDAVVYVIVQQQTDGMLRHLYTRVVNEAGEQGLFNSSFSVASSFVGVVLVYGIRYNTSEAKVKYGSLTSEDFVGFINAIRKAGDSDYTLTETKGANFSHT